MTHRLDAHYLARAVLLAAALAAPAQATTLDARTWPRGADERSRRERRSPATRRSRPSSTSTACTVILRRNTANEVVAANLYLLGGARQVTPANAGIEALLLLASERGTRRFPGATVRQRTATLGSTISIEANDDWSAIGLHAIRGTFDSTWAILADRVMAPTLAPGDVELAREQLITGARQRRDAARTTRPNELADSLIYVRPSVRASRPRARRRRSRRSRSPQLRAYHAQQFVTSRMLLVVVGNVDRADVERLVRRHDRDAAARHVQVDAAAAAAGGRPRGRDRQPRAADQLHARLRARAGRHEPRLRRAARGDRRALGPPVHRGPLATQPELRGGVAVRRARAGGRRPVRDDRGSERRAPHHARRARRRCRRRRWIPTG